MVHMKNLANSLNFFFKIDQFDLIYKREEEDGWDRWGKRRVARIDMGRGGRLGWKREEEGC